LFATWQFALFVAAFAVMLLAFGGVRPPTIARESIFILVFAVTAALVRFWGGGVGSADPASVAAVSSAYGIRLWAAFLAGRLFYASTRLSELRDAATRLARHIPLVRRHDIGLGLSLLLGCIPLIFEEWRESLEAARSRGMPRRAGIALQARFIMAFLSRLMIRAVAMPQSLVARGWSGDRGLAPLTWRVRDSICLTMCCVAFVAALLHLV